MFPLDGTNNALAVELTPEIVDIVRLSAPEDEMSTRAAGARAGRSSVVVKA